MNNMMFMTWLEHRLEPGLDNAPYHHGYDIEVRQPESSSNMTNTEVFHKYGAKTVTVIHDTEDAMGRKKI